MKVLKKRNAPTEIVQERKNRIPGQVMMNAFQNGHFHTQNTQKYNLDGRVKELCFENLQEQTTHKMNVTLRTYILD